MSIRSLKIFYHLRGTNFDCNTIHIVFLCILLVVASF